MSKKKSYKKNSSNSKAEEPSSVYKKRTIKIFHSFEEQEEFELQQMALLKPIELLQHLRRLINFAYGMHGYDPNNLPKKHSIRIIKPGNEHI